MLSKKEFNSLPYLAIILATIIWAGALPVIKITESYIPPFAFLFFRFVVVCAVALIPTIVELKRNPVNPKDLKNIVILGLLGQSSLALIFWGVKFSTTIDTAIISTIAPILTIAAGHYFFNEEVNRKTLVGILIATMGMGVVVLEPMLLNAVTGGEIEIGQRIFGNLLNVIYNVFFTFYILFSKVVFGKNTQKLSSFLSFIRIRPMTKAYSPMLTTHLTFFVALTTTLPFALLEHAGVFGQHGISMQGFEYQPILGVLYMALLSSLVAYVAFEWGVNTIEIEDTAILGYLGPLFTIPFSYMLLSEVPTQINLIGSGIIFIGVLIAERYKRHRLAVKSAGIAPTDKV